MCWCRRPLATSLLLSEVGTCVSRLRRHLPAGAGAPQGHPAGPSPSPAHRSSACGASSRGLDPLAPAGGWPRCARCGPTAAARGSPVAGPGSGTEKGPDEREAGASWLRLASDWSELALSNPAAAAVPGSRAAAAGRRGRRGSAGAARGPGAQREAVAPRGEAPRCNPSFHVLPLAHPAPCWPVRRRVGIEVTSSCTPAACSGGS